MCVILFVDKQADDVTSQEWERAASCHDDGYGVAWFDGGKVRYIKRTACSKELKEFRPPKPYVMHFRMATQGEAITKLCHPFPIAKGSPLRKKGSAKKVLFHNGHIAAWESLLMQATRGKLPRGPYSDSRAIAMAVHAFGPSVLTLPLLAGDRYCIMDAESSAIELYGSWDYEKSTGIYRSNDWHLYSSSYFSDYYDWDNGLDSTVGKLCFHEGCTNKVCTDSYIFCAEHKVGAVRTSVPKRCRYCGCILVLSESVQSETCVSCNESACVQCGDRLSKEELRDRESFCIRCRSSLDKGQCSECGVQLDSESPFRFCEDCLIIGGY